MDNISLRYAKHGKLASKPVLWGVTVNNSPTVQDVWNSTPVWGYPFASSGVAPTPAAAPLVDGSLAQNVAGLGTYALWADHVYGELTVYRSAPQGGNAEVSGARFVLTPQARADLLEIWTISPRIAPKMQTGF